MCFIRFLVTELCMNKHQKVINTGRKAIIFGYAMYACMFGKCQPLSWRQFEICRQKYSGGAQKFDKNFKISIQTIIEI